MLSESHGDDILDSNKNQMLSESRGDAILDSIVQQVSRMSPLGTVYFISLGLFILYKLVHRILESMIFLVHRVQKTSKSITCLERI